MAEGMRRCHRAELEADVHMDKQTKQRFRNGANAEWFDHYCFLFAASSNCAACVTYWLRAGADIHRTSMSKAYTALDFAEYQNATECVNILKQAAESSQSHGRAPTLEVAKQAAESSQSHRRAATLEVAPPPPPPGPPPVDDKQVFLRCFDSVDDARFWSQILNGDVGLCREQMRGQQLFLRPEYDGCKSEIPTALSTWGLREFIRLKSMRASSDHPNVQVVLDELDRKESQLAMDTYQEHQATDQHSLLYKTFSGLLNGHVVGHSVDPWNRECCRFWQLALTHEVEQLQCVLTDEVLCESLVASAWDARISHVPECKNWPLRMYCRVNTLRPDVDMVMAEEILATVLRAEEDFACKVAKKIPHMDAHVCALLDILLFPPEI